MKKLCAVILLAMPMLAVAQGNKGAWIKCVFEYHEYNSPQFIKAKDVGRHKIGDEDIFFIDANRVFEYNRIDKTLSRKDGFKFNDEYIRYDTDDSSGKRYSWYKIDRRTLGVDFYEIHEGFFMQESKGMCAKIPPLPVISNQL